MQNLWYNDSLRHFDLDRNSMRYLSKRLVPRNRTMNVSILVKKLYLLAYRSGIYI